MFVNFLFCFCLLSSHAPAGPLSTPTLVAQSKKSGKKVLLNYEAAKLVDVVKSISKLTGKNFIVEDSVRQRKLTIISGSRVTVDEAYFAFLEALDLEGLQIEATGKFFKINRLVFPKPDREKSRTSPPIEGISQIDEDNWRISAQAQKDIQNRLHSLSGQARIVPNFKNGKTNGFKLFSIRPGSLYVLLGIQNGDIIQRINGHEMTSPERALEVFDKLRHMKTITIELSRRGKIRKLTYKLE